MRYHAISRLCLRVWWCGSVLAVAFASTASAQVEVSVFLDSTAQTIRGFGAANIVGWRPDMTDAEIETAFGTDEGELGFTILRLRIPPQKNQWSVNVPSAQRAHSLGATIVASPWSPPADMKTNGDLVGGHLRGEMYDEYAAHLDSFVTYMADNGVPVYAVSVQNEPDIEVSYESCDWTPEEMVRFMRENASSIGTRVMAPESFQFRREMSDPILNDPEALENLGMVAGHIYGGGNASYPLAEEKGKEVWMTEYLMLDTTLDANLATAVSMQNAMTSGMSAYIWWYIVRYYGPISDGESDDYRKGEVTKRGYVMSQFSRFVRPGHVRVHSRTVPPRTVRWHVSATAYVEGPRLVLVAVNEGASALEADFTLEDGSVGRFRRYVTDGSRNVEQMDDVEVEGDRFTATLGARSVTTFVADDLAVANAPVDPSPSSLQLVQNYPNPVRAATSIGYTVPVAGDVSLEVFDVLGRRVATLVDGSVAAGSHKVDVDARLLPGGVYVYRLQQGDMVQTRRMAVIK